MYPCADFCVAPIESWMLRLGPGLSVDLFTYGLSDPGCGLRARPMLMDADVDLPLTDWLPSDDGCSYVPGPDDAPLSSSLPSRDHEA